MDVAGERLSTQAELAKGVQGHTANPRAHNDESTADGDGGWGFERSGINPPIEEVLADPGWEEVRQLAARVRQEFRAYGLPPRES